MTPEARASRESEDTGRPMAWATTISSSDSPAPKRRERAHSPPMLRAATSSTTGPEGERRSSACSGPSASPRARAAADATRRTASCSGAGWRDGVT